MTIVHTRVSGPGSVTNLKWTSVFGWCMVGCGSKNGYQVDICLEETRLCVQNMLIILDSEVNIMQGVGGGM